MEGCAIGLYVFDAKYPFLVDVVPFQLTLLCAHYYDLQTPIDGQYCGDTGNYQFDYSMQLPDEDSVPSGMRWLFDSVTLKIHVQKETGCQTQWKGAAYQLPYPMMGVVVFAGIAVALWRDRRRGRGNDEDDNDEDDETYYEDDSYVEMGSTTSSKPPVRTVSCLSQDTGRHSPARTVSFSLSQDTGRHSPAAHHHNLPQTHLYQSPVRKPPQNHHQNLSPDNMSQNPVGNFSRLDTVSGLTTISQNHPTPNNQISIEVLRQFYDERGIAIV